LINALLERNVQLWSPVFYADDAG